LSDLPERLLDAKVLTALDGLVEIGSVEAGSTMLRGECVETKPKWNGRSPAAPGYRPLVAYLPEIVSAGWHVRLTERGQVEAARTSDPKRKRRRSTPHKLTPIQQRTMEVVVECKGSYAKAARRLHKDRSTVKQAWEAACRILGLDPVTYGKAGGKTGTYLRDRRGQDDVADIDDQRLDADDQAIDSEDQEIADVLRDERQDQRRRYRKR
jgi:hypothetical protein